MPQVEERAYTLSFQGRATTLFTDVVITSNYRDSNKEVQPPIRIGVWDTGASKTTISPRIVKDLQLTYLGKHNASTANGYVDVGLYMVNVGLPNQVVINNLLVLCADIGNEEDILLGMDIITLGDFAITSVNGNTKFSYRFPSLEEIDYVKMINGKN